MAGAGLFFDEELELSVPLNIRPQTPLRGGLQSVAQPLPMTEEDWRTGVQVQPVCDLQPFVWACASEGEKDVSEIYPYYEFSSTVLGVMVECGPNGPNSPIGDIAKRSAQEGLERTRYSLLAEVLANGDVAGGAVEGFGENPSLQGTASVPEGFDIDNPAGLLSTIQGLLDAVDDCWQTDVIFHVPHGFLPHFLAADIVEWDEVRGVWHMGPYVFSFDMYPNLGNPAQEADSPTPQDGSQVWIYVSSPVMVAMSRESTVAARAERQNSYVVEANRGAIVVFDPCCTMGAKALVCDDTCGDVIS